MSFFKSIFGQSDEDDQEIRDDYEYDDVNDSDDYNSYDNDEDDNDYTDSSSSDPSVLINTSIRISKKSLKRFRN